MGIIFYFSSLQRVEVSEKDIINFLFFKTLHVAEYAILYFLLFRASKNPLFSVIFAILYAILDEVHQTFVPTREGKLRDVIIDSFGVFLMYAYIKRFFSLSFHPERKK